MLEALIIEVQMFQDFDGGNEGARISHYLLLSVRRALF